MRHLLRRFRRFTAAHRPRFVTGLELLASTVVVLLMAPVAIAHAAGGGHGHGHELHFVEIVTNPEFLAAVINFLVLVFILMKFGGKPVAAYLSGRRRQVEEGLLEAARLKEAAEKKQAEYAARIANLSREMEEIRAEMVRAGEAERDRIVAEAERKAARMRREVEFVISQQMKQLRADLTKEAVEAAIEAAGSVLKEQTNISDQQRLAQGYLERLKQSTPGGAP